MGDSIATNLFMVGYAWQRGLLPLSEASILRAIELNGASVESNKLAFQWGRMAAHAPAAVTEAATPKRSVPESQRLSGSLDEMVERRVKFLTDYQDAAYAKGYADLVARVRAAEARAVPGSTALAEAVARYDFKLRAIKDEYEVARLYAESDFSRARRRAVRGRLQARVPPRPADDEQGGSRRRASRGSRPTARG